MARPRAVTWFAAVAAVAAVAAAPALGRELHWEAIDVDARLESDDRLRVVETQEIVMTGDWNGGERRFRVAPDQRLTVERIVKIDPSSGAQTPLVRGDLARVDRWNFVGAHTVRWRSRKRGDPPFAVSRLTYRLELVYERVLRAEGDGVYGLDHDFAFADRPGPIERFRFRLVLGPGWEAVGEPPAAVEIGPLSPGSGHVVRARFRAIGEHRPAFAARLVRRRDASSRVSSRTNRRDSRIGCFPGWWRSDWHRRPSAGRGVSVAGWLTARRARRVRVPRARR